MSNKKKIQQVMKMLNNLVKNDDTSDKIKKINKIHNKIADCLIEDSNIDEIDFYELLNVFQISVIALLDIHHAKKGKEIAIDILQRARHDLKLIGYDPDSIFSLFSKNNDIQDKRRLH